MAKKKTPKKIDPIIEIEPVIEPVIQKPVPKVDMLKNMTEYTYAFPLFSLKPGQSIPMLDSYYDDKKICHAIDTEVLNVIND